MSKVSFSKVHDNYWFIDVFSQDI